MDPTTTPPPTRTRLPLMPLLFCAALFLVGTTYLVLALVKGFSTPERAPIPMSSVNLAEEAQKLVRQSKPAPLSGPLEKLLADAANNHFPSYEHPLVGKPAPDFTRQTVDDTPWSLKSALAKGPVVVVFYYGYYCNHCVSQLFDVKEDYERFRELGAEVVALSADSIDTTREKYKEYGRFPFPVLADRGNRVAEAYRVFHPAGDGKAEQLDHGTFVLDQNGIIRWAAFGPTPFGHNATLLYEVAKITGRLPREQ